VNEQAAVSLRSSLPGLHSSDGWAGDSKRSMYTDVAAARVGRRPDGVSESHVSKPIFALWLGFLQFGTCRWDNEKFW
jgi:hypothetical protein